MYCQINKKLRRGKRRKHGGHGTESDQWIGGN
jgi:hypothetical protein